MIEIADSGENIHLSKQATTITAPVITSNEMTERLTDGSTIESSHISTIQLSGISKQVRQIHIPPKMNTAPLIPLGVLCDDGCIIKLDKQDMPLQKNGQEIIRGTRNKKTKMWELPLENQQPSAVINKILAQTLKTELAQYFHVALFIPTTASLIKAIKKGFLKTWLDLKNNNQEASEKSRNATMVQLHMRRQGIQPTKEKPSDTYLEVNIITNVVFFTTVYTNTSK